MTVIHSFVANLGSDKMYIDLSYVTDPIQERMWILIKNQSVSTTFYFKIVLNVSNWSLASPSDGKLGSIGPGASKYKYPIIQRNKPSSDTYETGTVTIQAYSDSAYTDLVGEDILDIEIRCEDLENWATVTKNTFDTGSAEGWTLNQCSVNSEKSIEAGGYSLRHYKEVSPGDQAISVYCEKSISIPNKNKVRISCYFACRCYNSYTQCKSEFRDFYIQVDGTKIFQLAGTVFSHEHLGSDSWGWFKWTADLTNYKGQTKTIRIGYTSYLYAWGSYYSRNWGYVDDIVIAAKS